MHSSHTNVHFFSTFSLKMGLAPQYLKTFATMGKTVPEDPFLEEFFSALDENQYLAAVFFLKQAIFIGLPPKHL